MSESAEKGHNKGLGRVVNGTSAAAMLNEDEITSELIQNDRCTSSARRASAMWDPCHFDHKVSNENP